MFSIVFEYRKPTHLVFADDKGRGEILVPNQLTDKNKKRWRYQTNHCSIIKKLYCSCCLFLYYHRKKKKKFTL